MDIFWQQTAPDGAQAQRLEGDASYDVAVVGAGFTGLNAALHLAEAGVKVAVFDAGPVAHGASGRSGGQVNPMLPAKKPQELRRAVGDRYFERMAETSFRSADDVFDLVRKYQIRCEARQHGWIRAQHCDSARREANANAHLWNEAGAGFEFVDADEVTRLSGAVGYVGGVIAPKGGAIQPLALTRGLEVAARAIGADVFSFSPVKALERKEGRWHLRIGDHRVDAEQVIFATNGYTDGLLKGLRGSVLPLTPLQMAAEGLDDSEIGPLLPQGHTISDTRRLIMYCRREPGGQFLFGSTGYRKPLGGIGGFSWMLEDAVRIFPSLKNAKWKYRWGGRIALTSDGVPHLHAPQPGLIAGLGYNGRGVAMSHVMGREMARMALGVDPSQIPIPVTKIPRYKFRTPQVLGAGLAMAAMRWRDQRETFQGSGK
ncbi:FAD-binding oxidoreductase [Sulfitobacter sp. F26169L]|uniref:NAD(P)/FAD-dependent oxidoreductase n=1 Tax=Sulfitobacter sp. F26169L TaxID=2996015 RepID=UPI00226084E0|nr:FAD-binding oxidoreductase [Sulfitobacter sp. F26169L]MCX7566643.1 FAD-binding oxidoreductase [Sulfitobacter sp. F26169L]